MAQTSEHQYGTYRCPVCGHRDGAELRPGEEACVIACSYCETPLEIASRGPDSVSLSVQVTEAPVSR